jgi:type I site-specific restriction-modification system R (restriction) subunit
LRRFFERLAISIYDIQGGVADKATVPIYYEARLAQIDLKPEERPKIDPNFEEVTEDAEESTKESLRRKWAQLEAMVGTDKRIALVAEDLVKHWEARYAAMEGKAMTLSNFLSGLLETDAIVLHCDERHRPAAGRRRWRERWRRFKTRRPPSRL